MATAGEEPSPAARRRRRPRVAGQVVAFVGVLCAGVLIGWVVFRADGGAPAPPAATTAGAERVSLEPRVYPRLGVTFGLPRGWRTTFRSGVLNAASGDDTVSVALSAAGGAGEGQKVRRSDRNQLARLFKARELSRQRADVGSATTVVTELLGQMRTGRPIRILSMGPSSRWRTYSIQVFAVPAPAASRLAELRSLLASVRYRRPR